ncbi:MAG: DUF2330 domain-containing protein [Verrucomicrobiales bacterium]|nr:DUF2330 domain-containing protein [Verrucomicrobiota bacterium JB025]
MIRKAPSTFPLLRILFIFLALILPAPGDGKIYAPEEIPTSIPYQRAIILHASGKQLLILQSQYQIPKTTAQTNLGWIVPVPAEPTVGSIPAYEADRAFDECDSISQPKVNRPGETAAMVASFLILILPIVLGVAATISLLLPKSGNRTNRLWLMFASSLVAACVLLLTAPFLIRQKKGIGGVEVLQSYRAGIYDISVLRPKAAADLISWLDANSFHHDKSDAAAIQSHIDRGWCFVAAKVHTDTDTSSAKAVSKGLLAPLVITFPTPNPIYPTALTASAGHDTEILIYLISQTPMSAPSALGLRFRSNQSSCLYSLSNAMSEVEPPDFLDGLLDDPFWDFALFGGLQKFKGTLTPAQMASDITFQPSPEAPPYREKVTDWATSGILIALSTLAALILLLPLLHFRRRNRRP